MTFLTVSLVQLSQPEFTIKNPYIKKKTSESNNLLVIKVPYSWWIDVAYLKLFAYLKLSPAFCNMFTINK